jgi:hypothetical protein
VTRSSVSDLEHEAPSLASAAGADDRAKRPRDPALAADHLADVVLRDMEPEDERILALHLLDPNGVRVVHELSSEVLE